MNTHLFSFLSHRHHCVMPTALNFGNQIINENVKLIANAYLILI